MLHAIDHTTAFLCLHVYRLHQNTLPYLKLLLVDSLARVESNDRVEAEASGNDSLATEEARTVLRHRMLQKHVMADLPTLLRCALRLPFSHCALLRTSNPARFAPRPSRTPPFSRLLRALWFTVTIPEVKIVVHCHHTCLAGWHRRLWTKSVLRTTGGYDRPSVHAGRRTSTACRRGSCGVRRRSSSSRRSRREPSPPGTRAPRRQEAGSLTAFSSKWPTTTQMSRMASRMASGCHKATKHHRSCGRRCRRPPKMTL